MFTRKLFIKSRQFWILIQDYKMKYSTSQYFLPPIKHTRLKITRAHNMTSAYLKISYQSLVYADSHVAEDLVSRLVSPESSQILRHFTYKNIKTKVNSIDTNPTHTWFSLSSSVHLYSIPQISIHYKRPPLIPKLLNVVIGDLSVKFLFHGNVSHVGHYSHDADGAHDSVGRNRVTQCFP